MSTCLWAKKKKKNQWHCFGRGWKRVRRPLWHVSSRVHTSSVEVFVEVRAVGPANEWMKVRLEGKAAAFLSTSPEKRSGEGGNKTAPLLNTTHTHIRPFFLTAFRFFWALAEVEAHHWTYVGGLVLWNCGSGWDLDIKAYLKNQFAPAFIQSLFLFTYMIFYFLATISDIALIDIAGHIDFRPKGCP